MVFRQTTTIRVLVIATVIVAALGLAATAVALADPGDNETDGGNETDDGPTIGVDVGTDAGDGGENEQNETIATVDPAVRVTSVDYDGERVRLVVETAVRKPLTVVESTSGKSEGAGRINVRQVVLDDDSQNVIAIPVSGPDPAVVLSTSTSVNNGHATYIKVDSGGLSLPGPVTWDHVFLSTGLAGVGGVTIAVGLFKTRRETDPDPEVERFV